MGTKVEAACRDCRKCMGSPLAVGLRNLGRGSAAVMSIGISEAVMSGTKTCRMCGHKFSLHQGTDEPIRR